MLPLSVRPGGSDWLMTVQVIVPTPVAVRVALYGTPWNAAANCNGDVIASGSIAIGTDCVFACTPSLTVKIATDVPDAVGLPAI